ncbi:hypothetical protein [Streptomyces sp. NEAU-NA10]|uniref:hypothetical protein n=1 Tax=Streptomyces sp. NEAU-NA10 TaxID=3416050 RepID=UPI003CC6705E
MTETLKLDIRARRRTEPAPQPPPPLRPAEHQQLVMFPPPGRDLRRGQERGFPEVDAPEVAAALKAAVDDYAQRHGLGYHTAWGLDRGLRVLLSIQETPGARFRASDVLLLSDLLLPVRPLLKLLAQLDMLDDDPTPGVVTWFRERTVGLPEPMLGELTTWFELKLSGSTTAPRVKARPPRWIQRMVTHALPALRTWADQGKDSLRSVTRADVLAVLPDSGTPRVDMLQGLRHILRLLKNRRIIFTDPTAREHLRRATAGLDPNLRLPLGDVGANDLVGHVVHRVLVDQPAIDPDHRVTLLPRRIQISQQHLVDHRLERIQLGTARHVRFPRLRPRRTQRLLNSPPAPPGTCAPAPGSTCPRERHAAARHTTRPSTDQAASAVRLH